MNWEVMDRAIQEAEQTMRIADNKAAYMAGLLRGRLRRCKAGDLRALKKELRSFNSVTGVWK